MGKVFVQLAIDVTVRVVLGRNGIDGVESEATEGKAVCCNLAAGKLGSR
jgi:hypothetical protein